MFELIYRWQTVYQAGIEFLIALVGGAGVLWQISSDKEEAEDERQRRLNSVRIYLSVTLSDITSFIEKDANFFSSIYEKMHFHKHPSAYCQIFKGGGCKNDIRFDRSVLETLREFTLFADGEALKAIEILIRELQIYESRTQEIKTDLHKDFYYYNLIQNIADSVSLYQRVANLFPYARKDSNIPKYKLDIDDLSIGVMQLYEYAEGDDEIKRLLSYAVEKSDKLSLSF